MLTLIAHPFNSSKTTVNINGIVRPLTRSTSCKPRYWGNLQKNACYCCISKRSLAGSDFKYKGTAVSHCLKKGHCSRDILEEMSAVINRKYVEDDASAFVAAVIQHVRAFVVVSKFDQTEEKKGIMTEAGARRAILDLQKRGLLPPDKKTNCLSVTPLAQKSSQVLSLFAVSESSKCQYPTAPETMTGLYIVKQLKRGVREASRLQMIRESPLNQFALSDPNRDPNFPAIALDHLSFYFKTSKGKQQYVSVLPLAPGQSIFQYLKSYALAFKKGKTGTIQEKVALNSQENQIRKVMTSLGTKMARLHKRYMTRRNGHLTGKSFGTYGDFHGNNVFSTNDGDIVIIDPESFVYALKKARPVGKDLTRVYTFSTLRNASHQNQRAGNVDMTTWHTTVIKPLFKAYIKTFSYNGNGTFNKEDFEDILRILRNNFSLRGTGNDLSGVFINTGFIKTMWAYRKHVRRIINELEREIKAENP